VQAAYHFIPESELDGFADMIIASFVDGALCEPAPLARADLNAGFGFWSMTMTNWDMSERHFDPHAVLTTNTTPALILRNETAIGRAKTLDSWLESRKARLSAEGTESSHLPCTSA